MKVENITKTALNFTITLNEDELQAITAALGSLSAPHRAYDTYTLFRDLDDLVRQSCGDRKFFVQSASSSTLKEFEE